MGAFTKTILSSVALAALTASAFADETGDFGNIDGLVIEDFIGTVEIKTSRSKNVRAVITDGKNASYPVHMNASAGILTIKSDEDPDDTRWWDDVNWRRNDERAFEIYLQDFPKLVISVPQGTDVSLDSAVTLLSAGDIGGNVLVDEGHVEGEIGNMKAADINIHGSADLKLGNVAEKLNIGIHGSGDVITGSADILAIAIHGSGDVRTGDIAGSANVRISGSGDVTLGHVGGPGSFEIHGSGDIRSGDVKSGADISTHGSGDVSLASVAGKTTVSIHGSGDSVINGGRSDDLKVRVRGSGDFKHMGLATNPDVSVQGSGDVYISKYEGSIRTSGDGDITIAGRHYGDDH